MVGQTNKFQIFLLFYLSGLSLCQVIFVYSLSNNGTANENFLENYYKLAQPLQSLYYMLFAICTVSVFDRFVFHFSYWRLHLRYFK